MVCFKMQSFCEEEFNTLEMYITCVMDKLPLWRKTLYDAQREFEHEFDVRIGFDNLPDSAPLIGHKILMIARGKARRKVIGLLRARCQEALQKTQDECVCFTVETQQESDINWLKALLHYNFEVVNLINSEYKCSCYMHNSADSKLFYALPIGTVVCIHIQAQNSEGRNEDALRYFRTAIQKIKNEVNEIIQGGAFRMPVWSPYVM